MEAPDDRPSYRPATWLWTAMWLLLPAGVWLNTTWGLGPLAAAGLGPFAALAALIWPVESDRRADRRDIWLGPPKVNPWWRARSEAEWGRARYRLGVAVVFWLAAVGVESLLMMMGVSIIREY